MRQSHWRRNDPCRIACFPVGKGASVIWVPSGSAMARALLRKGMPYPVGGQYIDFVEEVPFTRSFH
jgi:hypothetical protein